MPQEKGLSARRRVVLKKKGCPQEDELSARKRVVLKKTKVSWVGRIYKIQSESNVIGHSFKGGMKAIIDN